MNYPTTMSEAMPADSALDHVSRVWARSASILVDRGEGAWLYDMDGRRYLDFTCGIGVTNEKRE